MATLKQDHGRFAARPPARVNRKATSLVWLAYLALYFAPWFTRPPGRTELIASAIGVTIFLLLYLDVHMRSRRSPLPHVIGMAVIGFMLAQSSPTWTVFNVFAAALAGSIQPRRTAILVLVGLQIAMITYGIELHFPTLTWATGLFFGVLAGCSTLWQAGLERKHLELLSSQDQVRSLAATAERERIARDLHDLLGHTLTLIAIKAELARRLVDTDEGRAKREMEDVAEAAREALAEVRSAISGMRRASLVTELDRAKRMLAAANVETSVRTGPSGDPPEGEAVLAMALREAVTNVIRHSGASSCSIGLDVEPQGDMKLVVVDNGRGGEIHEGAGLSGMRARLSAVGGRLDVQSDGQGTRVLVVLPRWAT